MTAIGDALSASRAGTGPAVAPGRPDPAYVARLTERLVSTTGRTHRTVSPLDDAPLAAIPQSSPEDVRDAFAEARSAQRRCAGVPIEERAAVLLRLHDLVVERRDEIESLLSWESGKARKDAFDETMHVALVARYYARLGARALRSERRRGLLPALTRVDVHRVPKGVVGVISPWNFPFTMTMSDSLPALVAGNAVVVKPDAQTMLVNLLGAELLELAGLPPGLFRVVAGPGPEIGPALVSQADHVSFTGSTATGRLIARGCADRLIGCSLELGGKNPMLVLRDADVERAAEIAVRGCFGNAGQLCVSMERIYVADQVYDRFVDRFVSRTGALTLGATPDWGNDVGPLASRTQLERVRAHVDDAVARGARVRTGGRARPDLAPTFFEPTVLEGVTPDMACFADETFGPVVAVYRFHDEADAVARANAGEYGLNGSVLSRDTTRARAVARSLRCGTVNVNEAYAATFGSIDAPMGGMRQSGLGRRQGPEGLHRYVESQAVATQRGLPLTVPFGLGDAAYGRIMTAAVQVLRRIPRP